MRNWPKERIELVVEMYRSGKTVHEIKAEIGGGSVTLLKVLRDSGVTMRPGGAQRIPLSHRLDCVNRTGGDAACWPWQGRTHGGYGTLKVNGTTAQAHRVAWELVNGPIPKGLCVCHSCDNRPCCNPAHLFLGTSADNTADCVAKGRQVKGVDCHKAVLTPVDVRQIRAAANVTVKDLALKYKVSISTIWHVLRRATWKSVE